jgi:hypothetical protein
MLFTAWILHYLSLNINNFNLEMIYLIIRRVLNEIEFWNWILECKFIWTKLQISLFFDFYSFFTSGEILHLRIFGLSPKFSKESSVACKLSLARTNVKYYYSRKSPCDKCLSLRDKYPICGHIYANTYTHVCYTFQRVAIDDIRQEQVDTKWFSDEHAIKLCHR